MTTIESDHGDPGGPWNLSKKLRFLDLLMFRGRVGVFDPLIMVWGVWNQARTFGNSILMIFLFLKTSNGPPEPKLGQLKVKRTRQNDASEKIGEAVLRGRMVWNPPKTPSKLI